MNKEIKIVAGVGLAAGTVAGAYYINELKMKRRNNMSFLGHDYDDVRERMEGNTDTIVNNFMEITHPDFHDNDNDCGLGEKVIGAIHNPNSSLSPIEKEKIKDMVKGMSEEEMKITLQNIPMTLIFNHIAGVLERNRQFAQSIQDAMSKLQE